MTKNLSIVGLVAAAAASSALVIGATPAKAACLSSNASTTCATFTNSGSGFQEVVDKAYTDTVWLGNTQLNKITFTQNNLFTAGLPIQLANIEYFNGTSWTSTNLSSTNFNITSNDVAGILSPNLLTGPVSIDPATFEIRYTILNNPSLTGGSMAAFESYVANSKTDGSTPQTQTRSHQLVANGPTAPVPAPLPILGISAAFGFSRRLRKQIKSFA